MTIDVAHPMSRRSSDRAPLGGWAARILRGALVGLALVAAWLVVLAVVMRISPAAPAALVLLPSEAFLHALPADVSILSQNAVSITLASENALTTRLYEAGAMLVLPAGLSGCAPPV